MIVITLTDCPYSLRGDLTRWLWEVNTGVYVGHVSARVREDIWERIKENAKNGRAVMVYSANNEQHMDFRIHNSDWEPIDFDGIKLMMRPSPKRMEAKTDILKPGFSNAAKNHTAKKMSRHNGGGERALPDNYVVVDIETTGLSAVYDKIIEIGAVIVKDGEAISEYQSFIKTNKKIPENIKEITGITDEMLSEGSDIVEALKEFKTFAGDYPIVSHNSEFDRGFLEATFDRLNMSQLLNRWVDTLSLSRKLITGVSDYKLATLLAHFNIIPVGAHRSCDDCKSMINLYEKLKEISVLQK